jgi:hypothetical protein
MIMCRIRRAHMEQSCKILMGTRQVYSNVLKREPKVDGFTDEKGIQHKPGDIVDLSDRYLKLDWLQLIQKVFISP